MTKESLRGLAKEISERFIHDDNKTLQELLEEYNFGRYEREYCYGYVLGQIKSICDVYDNCTGIENRITREDILDCLGYSNEADIKRFKSELKQSEEKGEPEKEKPKTKREELGERQWRKARAAFVNAYVCNSFSLDEMLDIFTLEGTDRADMYKYAIDKLRDIVADYDEEDSEEERWLYLDEMDINENDIQRFRDEISIYDKNVTYEETYEISLSQEEIRHALELVIVVENVIDMLGIDKYDACRICETPLFVYDFAKQVETLSGGFRLRISDKELDKLNEMSYRTACEVVEEYKAEEIEKVNCMSRAENEKLQKQRNILRLCYGSGYKMRDLEELGIFDVDAIEKEWSDFAKEEEWKCIVSDYSYDEILEEIRKHIGTRIAIAMGMDVKRAAHYYNMTGPEHCWATITAFQADRAGLVIPFSHVMAELDGMLADICALSKKIRTGQLD